MLQWVKHKLSQGWLGWGPNCNFDGQEGLGDRNISKLRPIGLMGVHKWQGGEKKTLD